MELRTIRSVEHPQEYLVYTKSGVFLGGLEPNNCGDYVFWPDLKGGYWDLGMMLEVASLLGEFNNVSTQYKGMEGVQEATQALQGMFGSDVLAGFPTTRGPSQDTGKVQESNEATGRVYSSQPHCESCEDSDNYTLDMFKDYVFGKRPVYRYNYRIGGWQRRY